MIRVHELRKTFGHITAVDDLSVEIEPGGVVGFLGPNGAGKTTAMRLITGFYAPDSGTVEIDGIPVHERPIEAQRTIGYLPENNPLYKDMLVSEFLSMSADLKGIPRSQRLEAFDFVVDAVGIDDVFYRPLGQLSKGYKQRVGIAVALVHKPRILILDEPTEGLDPIQRGEIRSLITALAADHTIIMSTHIMQEVQAVATRVLIINKGTLVADGTAAELSRMARSERIVTFEAEGRQIERQLRRLDVVQHLDVEPVSGQRVLATITTGEDADVRPELSRLAREGEWTIWRLQEQEHKLEDIFYQLTQEA